jgi:hypothetical protein
VASRKRPCNYPKRGNTKIYLEGLLQRRSEAHYERYVAGEYKSALAACVDAGLRTKQITYSATAWGFYRATWDNLDEAGRRELLESLLRYGFRTDAERAAYFAAKYGWIIEKQTDH